MNDDLIETVTKEVLHRLQSNAPKALLIGSEPTCVSEFVYTNKEPYDAIVIGSLTVSELLCFQIESVYSALLHGMPVYWNTDGLPSNRYSASGNRTLLAEIRAQERRLRQLGIKPLHLSKERKLITAQQAERYRMEGCAVPKNAVLTPLAREILEGHL